MVEALVAYASRMGGTAEIAEVAGQVLRDRGIGVRVAPCTDVASLEGVDAVLVGSAVYLGRWQHDAVTFLERFGPELAARQTWLFQSGPCGPDDHGPADEPAAHGGAQDEEDVADASRGSGGADAPTGGADDDPGWTRVPRRVVRLAARFGLPHPVTFGGRLDAAHADDPVSRWVASGPLAGDRRDWDVIRAWAAACADAVLAAGPCGVSPELAAALGPGSAGRCAGGSPLGGSTSGT